jgi:hypothetical protein
MMAKLQHLLEDKQNIELFGLLFRIFFHVP